MSDLPAGWAETTLGDVFEWGSGGTPSRSSSAYYGGDIPWVVIGDLNDATVTQTSEKITLAGLENSSAKWVPAGAVLLAMYGSIGKLGVAGCDLTTNQAIAFAATPDGVQPKYLFYYLLRLRPTLVSSGKGGTQSNISQTVIKATPFVCAPSAEQSRIVDAIESYLSRLDAAVASLERVQSKLKAYRASVLKAAVEGKLVPTEAELARQEGREYEPAQVLLDRILRERRRRWEEAELARLKKAGKTPKDDSWKAKYEEPKGPDTSELPTLPEGWCWASVDQLTDGERKIAYGVLVPGPDVAGGIPFIRVGDLRDGTVDTSELKFIDKSIADQFPRTYVEGGEVLISLVGTIGRTAIVPSALAGANVARAVGVFPSTSLASARWIEMWFRSPGTRARLEGKAHEVARKTLNLEDVRPAPIAMPPRSEQERIVSQVEDLESFALAHQVTCRANLLRIARLRQSVLKWAFEGKLVDQDPNDEPAEKLLERIRAERAGAVPEKKPRGRKPKAP